MPRRLTLLVLSISLVFVASSARTIVISSPTASRFTTSSKGKGEAVVLIHGFAASIPTQWGGSGVIKDLSKDHQVIAMDNRGHGRSGKPHEPRSTASKWSRTSSACWTR